MGLGSLIFRGLVNSGLMQAAQRRCHPVWQWCLARDVRTAPLWPRLLRAVKGSAASMVLYVALLTLEVRDEPLIHDLWSISRTG